MLHASLAHASCSSSRMTSSWDPKPCKRFLTIKLQKPRHLKSVAQKIALSRCEFSVGCSRLQDRWLISPPAPPDHELSAFRYMITWQLILFRNTMLIKCWDALGSHIAHFLGHEGIGRLYLRPEFQVPVKHMHKFNNVGTRSSHRMGMLSGTIRVL